MQPAVRWDGRRSRTPGDARGAGRYGGGVHQTVGAVIMSLVQKLVETATSAQGPAREHALLLLDLTKFVAGPLASNMVFSQSDLGFSASKPSDHAPYHATKHALALEEAAKVVVAKFAVPGLSGDLHAQPPAGGLRGGPA